MTSATPVRTAFWAVALLFFVQLFTLYVESIYRLSLIKTSMGPEIAGVLFMLAPLLLVLLGRRGQRVIAAAAIAGLVVSRCVAPYLGARAQIVCAGFGVACFLILMSYALADANLARGVAWDGAIVIAVLASLVFRHTIWATLDWSMEPAWLPFAMVLVALVPLSAFVYARGSKPAVDGDDGPGFTRSTPQCVAGALTGFASLTLVYLVATSPGVTSAWSYADLALVVPLATVAWSAALFLPRLGRIALIAWNAAFIVVLLWGILANRVSFPDSPEAVVVDAGLGAWWQHLPIYLMLVLSPVLARNFHVSFASVPCASGRVAALAVFFGGLGMFGITLLLVFSNVWGYVEPISGYFRNMFHLPFLIAGVIVVLGLVVLRHERGNAPHAGQRWARGVGGLVGAVLLAWTGFTTVLAQRAALPHDPDRMELRVLTYNMQQGSEQDGDQRYLAQLDFIRSIQPDLVLLQESDTSRPSGGNVDAPRLVASALRMHLYYGPKTVAGTFGTAILSRYPLTNVRTVYTFSDVDEVGTAVAEIEVGGRTIGVFNNHPAGSDVVKHAHVDALLAEAAKYEHVIAGGDYNFRQDTPYYAKVVQELRDTWLMAHPDAVGDATSVLGGDPADEGRFSMERRIDHVFVSDGFEPVDAQYILTPDSMTDHPAYWCVLRW